MISMEGFSFWELKHEGKLDLFGLLESLAYRYRVRGMGLWNAFFPGQAQRQEVPEEYSKKEKAEGSRKKAQPRQLSLFDFLPQGE